MFRTFEIQKTFTLAQNPNTAKPTFEVMDERGKVRFRSTSVRACSKWIKDYNKQFYSGVKK